MTIASDLKLGSNVSGSSGNVVQSGGTLTITDTTTNRPLCIGEYSNETSSYTLSGGSLSVLGGPTYDPYNGSSGILAISGGTASLKEVIVGSGSGYNGTLAISGGGALYVGTGGLVNNGGSATVSINNGTLGAYANWSSSLAMSLTGGATVDSGSNTIALSGVLSGTGSLSKIGNGLLTLSGANTYSGPTTVSGGTLALNNSSASVDTYNGGNIAINNGSTLEVTYTGTDGQYNFGGKTFTFDSNGGGTILTGSNVNFVSTSANTFATSGGAQDTIGGLSVVNMNGVGINFNLTRGTGASDLKVTTGLDNSSGGLNLTGNGILELDVVNSYTGGTAISGGTLLIASGGVLGGGSYSGAIANSGTLVFNTSTNQTLNGSISGIGSLVEAGPGALALASNYSTYTGGTTVNGGVLNINYSPNSGTGTIRGNLTINAGGKVSINSQRRVRLHQCGRQPQHVEHQRRHAGPKRGSHQRNVHRRGRHHDRRPVVHQRRRRFRHVQRRLRHRRAHRHHHRQQQPGRHLRQPELPLGQPPLHRGCGHGARRHRPGGQRATHQHERDQLRLRQGRARRHGDYRWHQQLQRRHFHPGRHADDRLRRHHRQPGLQHDRQR